MLSDLRPTPTDRLSAQQILEAIERYERGVPSRPAKRHLKEATLPHVTFMSVDPSQRLLFVGPNRMRIEGRAAKSLFAKNYHLITVDGHVLRVELSSGEGPLAVAERIRASLPPGYTATLHPGHPATASTSVSFWRL